MPERENNARNKVFDPSETPSPVTERLKTVAPGNTLTICPKCGGFGEASGTFKYTCHRCNYFPITVAEHSALRSPSSPSPVTELLRAAYAKRGIQLEAYLAGPRNDRFERVESHGFDDAVSVVQEVLAALRSPSSPSPVTEAWGMFIDGKLEALYLYKPFSEANPDNMFRKVTVAELRSPSSAKHGLADNEAYFRANC